MARLPRYTLAHQLQHVIQRGNNRVTIFSADGDRSFFLDKLAQAGAKHGCAIHAYVLMTNARFRGRKRHRSLHEHPSPPQQKGGEV